MDSSVATTGNLRQVACIPFRDRRVPDAPGEVVAHLAGRTLTVTVRRVVGRAPEVLEQEFECGRYDDCLRAVRAWLHSIAMPESPAADAAVRAWAENVARRVLAGLAN